MRHFLVVGTAVVLLALAGCTSTSSDEPTAEPSSSAPSAVPTPAPSPTVTVVDPAAYTLPWLGASDGVAFDTDDRNINCGISINPQTGDSYGCGIRTYTYTDPKFDSQTPCGHGFWRYKTSKPSVLCTGEPAPFAGSKGGAKNVKILPVGSTITFNKVTCDSATDGVTCLSADGYGFRVSADSYDLIAP
jgi:hypothetical protein